MAFAASVLYLIAIICVHVAAFARGTVLFVFFGLNSSAEVRNSCLRGRAREMEIADFDCCYSSHLVITSH